MQHYCIISFHVRIEWTTYTTHKLRGKYWNSLNKLYRLQWRRNFIPHQLHSFYVCVSFFLFLVFFLFNFLLLIFRWIVAYTKQAKLCAILTYLVKSSQLWGVHRMHNLFTNVAICMCDLTLIVVLYCCSSSLQHTIYLRRTWWSLSLLI